MAPSPREHSPVCTGVYRWAVAPFSLAFVGIWWIGIIVVFTLARIPSYPHYVLILAPLPALLISGGFDPRHETPWLQWIRWVRWAHVVSLCLLTTGILLWIGARGGSSGDYGVAYRVRLEQARAIAREERQAITLARIWFARHSSPRFGGSSSMHSVRRRAPMACSSVRPGATAGRIASMCGRFGAETTRPRHHSRAEHGGEDDMVLLSTATPTRTSIATNALALCVVVLAGGLCLAWPFWGDQALFTVYSREMTEGAVLYRDLFDVKQPGIFLFYAAGGLLFGFTEIGIHLFELVYWLAF